MSSATTGDGSAKYLEASSASSNLRGKTKRPQLSCNPCRARKVKCDRILPCTACSLHQIAESCNFDLTDSERHPILQAEALKAKDKEISYLRDQLRLARSGPGVPIERPLDRLGRYAAQSSTISGAPNRAGANHPACEQVDGSGNGAVFETSTMTSVIQELARLSVEPQAFSFINPTSRNSNVSALHTATSHPFPTLWFAKDGTPDLVKLLPSEEILLEYLDLFEDQVQPIMFPHMPLACTRSEVQRFLSNAHRNASLYPDMLALIFATAALGIANIMDQQQSGRLSVGLSEHESAKGDVFIAAAMQALRLASFMNRPTLLVVETLLLIGPYLVNSGRFFDAWSLFGVTIRLALCINLHREPSNLQRRLTSQESMVRRRLWWWILYTDLQLSSASGRPLASSTLGSLPPPESLEADEIEGRSSSYTIHFTTVTRQILATTYLDNTQIDQYTNSLVTLNGTIPEVLRFQPTWLGDETTVPPWPYPARAAILHAEFHTSLLLLNRRRTKRRESYDSAIELPKLRPTENAKGMLRGRDCVLTSCREVLLAFRFLHIRVRPSVLPWTTGQQAFNAGIMLLLSMLETGDFADMRVIQSTCNTFMTMDKFGFNKFARVAAKKLGTLMSDLRDGKVLTETVMGKEGMFLPEEADLRMHHPGDPGVAEHHPASRRESSEHTDPLKSVSNAQASNTGPVRHTSTSVSSKKRLSTKSSHRTQTRPQIITKVPKTEGRRSSKCQKRSGSLTPTLSTSNHPMALEPAAHSWTSPPTPITDYTALNIDTVIAQAAANNGISSTTNTSAAHIGPSGYFGYQALSLPTNNHPMEVDPTQQASRVPTARHERRNPGFSQLASTSFEDPAHGRQAPDDTCMDGASFGQYQQPGYAPQLYGVEHMSSSQMPRYYELDGSY